VSVGKRIVRSGFIFSILATPLAGWAEPPDFLAELNLVREAMLDEPAKGYYEGPFNKAFYGQFSTWLNQCTQQTGQALADLDLIVGLDSQGRVSSLRAQPQSEVTQCFVAHVKREQFPAPPSGSLRVPVSVRITKQ
jgi:hypothetical protein